MAKNQEKWLGQKLQRKNLSNLWEKNRQKQEIKRAKNRGKIGKNRRKKIGRKMKRKQQKRQKIEENE